MLYSFSLSRGILSKSRSYYWFYILFIISQSILLCSYFFVWDIISRFNIQNKGTDLGWEGVLGLCFCHSDALHIVDLMIIPFDPLLVLLFTLFSFFTFIHFHFFYNMPFLSSSVLSACCMLLRARTKRRIMK